MGLNILVTKLGDLSADHPDWDYNKYGGDREVAAMLGRDLPTEYRDMAKGYPDVEPYWRPSDFAAWRAAKWPEVNEDRWQLLIDILERDQDYWIYLSV